MKELSIEEKAKAYDEAIDKVAHFIRKHIGLGCIIHPNSSEAKELFNIFPTFKESEDEKIRKLLIEAVIQVLQDQYCSNRGVPKEKVVAWLEKQGNNPTPINTEKMVMEYSKTANSDFGLPLNCMIRAYRQGINDALNLSSNIEKQDEQKSTNNQFTPEQADILDNI